MLPVWRNRPLKIYQFTKDVCVEGVKYREGDTVGEGDILRGCLESCLRVGWLVEDEQPQPVLKPVPVEQPKKK